ncbi:MAG: MFS transporter [Rhodobacteraceae bacterium]|nr:MFS transporter [Paracoccaceae bacterium]
MTGETATVAVRSSRKSIWGWYFYDWAAQPYNTLLITFIFGPYFASTVVGDPVQGQIVWGAMLTIVGLSLAVSGPILGAIADSSGPRKPWMLLFSLLYICGATSLWWALPASGYVTAILFAFGVGMIGMELTQVFANAILPSLAPREELGRISGTGWGFGYLGGVIALAIMMLLFAEDESGLTFLKNPPLFGLDAVEREGTRFVGPFTALWYFVFILPFFLFVPDVVRKKASTGAIKKGLSELVSTVRTLPDNISLAAYLMSSMFYRDALNALYQFGGLYAGGVLGWSIIDIGVFGIVAALSGALFCWLGGFADQRFGPKVMITYSIVALIIVCLLIVGTSRETFFGAVLAQDTVFPDRLFMVCGVIIGAAGGILQASSRTMVIDQARPDRMTEAFGLYALSGRATAFMAPALITQATLITQNQRLGVSPLILLFLIGLAMLFWVRSAKEYR